MAGTHRSEERWTPTPLVQVGIIGAVVVVVVVLVVVLVLAL